ncbi:retrovirus-related pol polyprotein from transposon TNT 1-94, partial [Tanacetum coccineum]
IDRLSKGKSEKGLVAESFDWDEESVSSEDEGVTKVKAFMAIAEEEPYVGKNDDRSGNMFLTIPMLISIIWRIRGKTCSASSTLLTKELSSCKSELADLKNTKALNFSLQNEIARLNLENESQRHEISDLKKVIEKWTSSKVTVDQLFTKQVPGNIIHALGGRGKKKDTISSKEVLFYKAAESPFETVLEITSDSESECGNLEPLPPLPINPLVPDKGSTVKALKKKAQTISPSTPDPILIKKADSSTKKLLLTLMEEGTIFNQNNEVVLIAPRGRDVYVIYMSSYNEESNACFFAKASNSVNWHWHKRLSHLNFKNINKLAIQNFVASVPSLTFSKDKTCSACEKGKHHRASFKTNRSFSINKCLHLLHMDLFGHVKPQTISHNKYTLVIVDEYSRKMENLNEVRVKKIRSDNGTKFKNHKLEEFYDEKGISQNFSSPCTPAQNGIAERRNKTLIEAARTMLNSENLPKFFWAEAVNTACYTQNSSIIVKRHRKTAYDVFRGRSPHISYFYVFGCPVHIHNHKDHLRKFNAKADDGFFLGYSLVAKAFREKNTPILQDLNSSDEHPEFTITDDHPVLNEHDDSKSVEDLRIAEDQVSTIIRPVSNVEPSLTIISPSVKAGVTTRSRIRESEAALANECLYGYNQQEGIDYDEIFAPIARLEAIRIFLAYAAYIGFVVFQMDVKSDFLNGKISKEVYVQQPPGFESSEFPNHMCKLDKALYGLEQAPRAWDYILKGDIELHFVPTELQLADIFTKPLAEPRFTRLIAELGMLNIEKEDPDKKKRSEKFVPLPPKETVKAALATLGLVDDNDTSISSINLANLTPFENEVPLTAHMCKLENLSPEPTKALIPPSREVNNDDTANKSLSKINVQHVTQSKATTDKKLRKKKSPTSSKLKTLIIVRESSLTP